MVRIMTLITVLALIADHAKAETPLVERQAPWLEELRNEPGAVRGYQLNPQGEIIALELCGHLAPPDIAAVKKIDTLERLAMGGDLPTCRLIAPPPEDVAAEARRRADYPRALPQLGDLPSLRWLELRHIPTTAEIHALARLRQLETLIGDIPAEHYGRLGELTRLKSLNLADLPSHELPKPTAAPEFLASLAALESLALPATFGDQTLRFLEDKGQLTEIKGRGLSGEALVDYFTEHRHLPLFDALRAAGYRVEQDAEGRICELRVYDESELRRLASKKVFARLTDLRRVELHHAHAHHCGELIRSLLLGNPVERLSINAHFDPGIVGDIRKIKSLRELHLSVPAEVTTLPEISDLPNLRKLSLGYAEGFKTELTAIAGLPQLTQMRLAGATISATLASQLRALPRLRRLELPNCVLEDDALDVVSGMSQLESLTLSGTDIGDQDLPKLARLPNLTALGTADTRVTADGRVRFLRDHLRYDPRQILEDAGVKCEGDERAQITGLAFGQTCGVELIRAAAELPAVERVRFSRSRLDADAVRALAQLPRLQELRFINCPTLDAGMIDDLRRLPGLRSLTVGNRRILSE